MRFMLMTFLVVLSASFAYGQVEESEPQTAEAPVPSRDSEEAGDSRKADERSSVALDQREAPDAVREGNRLLRAGDAEQAMRAYERAHELAPTAHEIDFDKGLAQFKLGDYEAARQAFENAALSPDDSLVDDAIYSIGNTYHAEALAKRDKPQEAIPLLENAMQRYQSVLAGRKDHEAAREANYKAASLWRTMKKQLEQQQQQQQQQDSEQDEEQQEDQDKQQQQSQQENQEQQDQQQQSQDQQQENQDQQSPQDQQDQQQDQQQQKESDQQQQQDQQSSQDEEQQQDQAQSAEQQQQQDQQQQQAQAQRQAEEARRQAERQLRDLMQELRQRNKRKPEEQHPIRPAPVEKDW